MMLQLYEFTVLRFYRLFLLTLQSIDTVRFYEFIILRLYHLLLSTLSTKKHKFAIYGFALASFAFTSPLRIYRLTASRLHYLFLSVLYAENMNLQNYGILRFYFDSLRLHPRFTILCLCNVPLLGLLFNFQKFSTVDATP